MATDNPGRAMLRDWFALQPHLIKAHEAESMGMSKQQLAHILAGRRRPTLKQALAIACHTGVPIALWSDE